MFLLDDIVLGFILVILVRYFVWGNLFVLNCVVRGVFGNLGILDDSEKR